MSEEQNNLIPDDYWSQFSPEEMEAIQQAMDDANDAYFAWDEMDGQYYDHLRDRFKKGPDEIGPRQFKTYMNRYVPILMIVIPAGKQHDGESMVQHYHTITEDMEFGECNGVYEMLTENQLEEKFNIKYNN
jgi:hypothetical protein